MALLFEMDIESALFAVNILQCYSNLNSSHFNAFLLMLLLNNNQRKISGVIQVNGKLLGQVIINKLQTNLLNLIL